MLVTRKTLDAALADADALARRYAEKHAADLARVERQLRRAREDGVALEATNDQLSSELMTARRELAAERATREAAEKAATIAQNNFEWCRLTLNATEQRSAELMAHVLKGPVTTALHLDRVATTRADAKDVIGVGLPSSGPVDFEDIGDEAARVEGAQWDGEGVVSYGTNGHDQQQR